MFSSTDTKAFTWSAALRSAAAGNGQSVIGRISPTFKPSFRASATAFFATRDAMPNATTHISASSIWYSSQSASFSSTALYLSYRAKFVRSSSSGLR